MADVIHRTTLEFRPSVNTPDFPEPTWKRRPVMTGVAGVPRKYWKAPPDWDAVDAGPVEMTQGEKDVVDAAAKAAAKTAVLAGVNGPDRPDLLRAVALLVLDEFNAHAAKVNALLTAIDNAASLGALKTAVALIADLPTRTVDQLKTALASKMGA